MTALLEMRGITKRFPGVLANDNVDFDVRAGEVHTLFGENGAGKSTLMRVLYGFYQPDSGQVYLDGKPVGIGSPAAAIALGIGMIHQHFMLVPTLTVAENVSLGLKSTRGPLKDIRRVSARIEELSALYGLGVNPSALIWQLSVGERQRVEIIKALYRQSRLLVLDEPTAVLTPREVDDLFRVLKKMAARGLRLDLHLAQDPRGAGSLRPHHRAPGGKKDRHRARRRSDRRTAGRDDGRPPDRGRGAVHGRPARRGQAQGPRPRRTGGPWHRRGAGAVAGHLRRGDRRHRRRVGQRPARAGGGDRRPAPPSCGVPSRSTASSSAGKKRVGGAALPAWAMCPRRGCATACIGDFSVAENLMLVDSDKPAFVHLGFLRRGSVRARAKELVAMFDVRTPGIDTPTRNLSGGNIQKLILARELSGEPKVLLIAQPTRGIDVAAARYIHERLREEAAKGIAVVIISEDLDEIIAVSHRALVMYEGAIIGEVRPAHHDPGGDRAHDGRRPGRPERWPAPPGSPDRAESRASARNAWRPGHQ